MMVDFAGLCGFHYKRDTSPFRATDQMLVDGARSQQHTDRWTIRSDCTVRQDDDTGAGIRCGFRLGADALQGRHQPFGSRSPIKSDINNLTVPTTMIQGLERSGLVVRQDGMRHSQSMTMRRRGLEQVLLRADETLQRHDHILTNRVDRGIGHLCKQLLEVIVSQSGLIRKTGERRVITHGSHRIPLFMHQGNQHEIEALPGIAKSAHTGNQGIGIQAGDLRRHDEI